MTHTQLIPPIEGRTTMNPRAHILSEMTKLGFPERHDDRVLWLLNVDNYERARAKGLILRNVGWRRWGDFLAEFGLVEGHRAYPDPRGNRRGV